MDAFLRCSVTHFEDATSTRLEHGLPVATAEGGSQMGVDDVIVFFI